MMKHRFAAAAPAALLVALLVAGCATLDENYVAGKALIEGGQREEGLRLVERAVQKEPRNAEYRAYWFNQRLALGVLRTAEAEAAVQRGDFDIAEQRYNAALAADPGNTRAAAGLAQLRAERENRLLLAQAEKSLAAGRLAEAEAAARKALDNDPRSRAARELFGRVSEAQVEAQRPKEDSSGPLNRQVTLEFRDATLRSVFEAVARSTGVNFVFDKDVRADTRVTFFVRNTRLGDLLRMVLITQQLEHRLLNANSLLIYPNSPQKLKEYQELAVRSFYVGNADVKQTLNMLRTVLKTRDLFVDEKLNLLVMRDTPDAIRLAEKLIAAQDLPEPEVLLELEVMEIKRGKLQELGIQWPNTFTVLNIVPTPTTVTTAGGVVTSTTNATTTTTQLTLANLRRATQGSVGVSPNPALNVRAEDSDVTLLANPRIRVRNRDKAKVHIGDRVPVITTTATANVGVAESVNYLEVGLKLEVEPNVYLDQDVAIKVSLDVSSIVREVKSNQGTLAYQLGTRNAATSLRVKDGETQILAGLISDDERKTASKLPLLGDLPIVGRLFGSWREDRVKTEIVLLITPRVVRNVAPPSGYVAQLNAGTESAVGAAPFALAANARAGVAAAAGAAARPSAGRPPALAAAAPGVNPAAVAGDAAAGGLSARLEWRGATSGAPGGAVQIGVALAEGPPDARGTIEFIYDPALFAAEGAAAPGRVTVPLAGGTAQVQLRVLAQQPGAISPVQVGAIALDAGGLPVQAPAPAPREIAIGGAR
jgi:general secretion pathway protein D